MKGVTRVSTTVAALPLRLAAPLAEAIFRKSGARSLIWNLCDHRSELAGAGFSTVNTHWLNVAPLSPQPTLEHLLEIVNSVDKWLQLSADHRALIACADGLERSSLVAAAFMK